MKALGGSLELWIGLHLCLLSSCDGKGGLEEFRCAWSGKREVGNYSIAWRSPWALDHAQKLDQAGIQRILEVMFKYITERTM